MPKIITPAGFLDLAVHDVVNRSHWLAESMVGWWLALPRTSRGGSLYDVSGQARHGTLSGASSVLPAWEPTARPGGLQGLNFTGSSSQQIALPNLSAAFPTSEGTFSVWLKLKAETPANANYCGFASLGAYTYCDNYPYLDGKIYISAFDTTRPISAVTAPTGKTSWHHLTIVSRAGSGNYKLYINGAVFATGTRGTWNAPSSSFTAYLGGDTRTGIQAYFDGWADDWRIWARGFSDAEVKALYEESLAGYPSALQREPTYVPRPSASTITATGSLAVGAIVVAGSGSVRVPATGSLAVGAVTVAGSASVRVGATGALSIGSVVVAGTAGVRVGATGSLAIGPITVQGASASTVFATGTLAIDPIVFAGVALIRVDATGTLAVDPVVIAGAESPGTIDATGTLEIGAVVIAGADSGPTYDGPTILHAIAAWWAAQADLMAMVADGRLWHIEAPEGVYPPYVTFFTVAETEREGRTTDYAYLDSVIQFAAHGRTDLESALIRKALRQAILGARLAVDGVPAWYCLPGGQSLQIGEGFGPNGSDCWIATVDVEIPWQTDSLAAAAARRR